MNKFTSEFLKVLATIDYGKNEYEIFTDFLEMSCLAFANIRYLNNNQTINDRYSKIAEKYNDEQISKIGKLLAITSEALEYQMQDFLGEVYMSAGFGSNALGQFFTPYSVCKLCADCVYDGVPENRIVRLNEPCVGGGAMVIAFAEKMREQGINYQQFLYVEATDLSWNSVCMAFIQFSLLGIPATVYHGNTISLEMFGAYETPMVGFNLIKERLESQKRHDEMDKIEPVVKVIPVEQNAEQFGKTEQLEFVF